MSLPSIVTVPHPALRQRLDAVTQFDQALIDLSQTMLKVMQRANGVGLAANQVDCSSRLFVYAIDEPFESNGVTVAAVEPQVVINPTITVLGQQVETDEEGCLSIPNLYGPVSRPTHIRLDAQDLKGTHISREVTGYEARIIQHETDHLNGILFLDLVTDPTKIRRA